MPRCQLRAVTCPSGARPLDPAQPALPTEPGVLLAFRALAEADATLETLGDGCAGQLSAQPSRAGPSRAEPGRAGNFPAGGRLWEDSGWGREGTRKAWWRTMRSEVSYLLKGLYESSM